MQEGVIESTDTQFNIQTTNRCKRQNTIRYQTYDNQKSRQIDRQRV